MDSRLQVSREFLNGMAWIQSHRVKLHTEYQGKWIAVYRDKVVASGKSIDSVEKKALEITKEPYTKIPMVFMEDPHCIYPLD